MSALVYVGCRLNACSVSSINALICLKTVVARVGISSDACPAGCQTTESLEHLFRDCPRTHRLWIDLGVDRDDPNFFSLPFASWVRSNILSRYPITGVLDWAAMFAMALWWTWKWRNRLVFEGLLWSGDRGLFIRDYAAEYRMAGTAGMGFARTRSYESRLISWSRPPQDWVKVNSDGCLSSSLGAAAGGLLRGPDGAWIMGFTHKLGLCTVPKAELWGIYDCLSLAWDLGFRRVLCESDSQLAIRLISSQMISSCHSLASLVLLCHGLLRRSWTVEIRHVYREANRAADAMASLALFSPLSCTFVSDPPESVLVFVQEDSIGVSTPWTVSV